MSDFTRSRVLGGAATATFRRQTFGDLTSVFRQDHTAELPLLPETGSRLNLATYETAQLPAPTFPGPRRSSPTRSAAPATASDEPA